MKKNSSHDLISDLPESIIEKILTKLPIRDAVKTSVLSTTWRYRWASMRNLVFDDQIATDYTEASIVRDRIVKFITKFLLHHDGPIHNFSLCSSYLESTDIDRWPLFALQKDVKKLDLELGETFRAPSCLFSFKNLVQLDLVRCELNPPPNFKGFLLLKHLILAEVKIPQDDVVSLISSCPLLENLNMVYYASELSIELAICAPKLKHLFWEGDFKGLCLANTPDFVVASFHMFMIDFDKPDHSEQSSSCNFDKVFCGVPKLRD